MKEIIHNDDLLKDNEIDEQSIRARGLIINSKNEILMCYSNGLQHYEFPGGHLEENETLIAGLKREIKEETGIIINVSEITPLMSIKYYCKNYHNRNKNRLASIYYYIINTDNPYNPSKTNLDKMEISQNYECRYIKISDLKNIIIDNKKTTKENNQTLDDLLIVWDEYLKKYRK